MRPEITFGLFLLVYFLPTLVAARRNHHNDMAIALLNLLLGWTVLGWIAALIWAATAVDPARVRQKPEKPPKKISNMPPMLSESDPRKQAIENFKWRDTGD